MPKATHSIEQKKKEFQIQNNFDSEVFQKFSIILCTNIAGSPTGQGERKGKEYCNLCTRVKIRRRHQTQIQSRTERMLFIWKHISSVKRGDNYAYFLFLTFVCCVFVIIRLFVSLKEFRTFGVRIDFSDTSDSIWNMEYVLTICIPIKQRKSNRRRSASYA